MRRNFVNHLHHRMHSDALKYGVSLGRVTAMQDFVRAYAGKVHDSVHKEGKHGKHGKTPTTDRNRRLRNGPRRKQLRLQKHCKHGKSGKHG